jgi:hypothetical protein
VALVGPVTPKPVILSEAKDLTLQRNRWSFS